MKSSLRKVLAIAFVALTASAFCATRSLADTIAFNENGAPDSTPSSAGLDAFQFTPTQDIVVTQLGFYAQSIGGGDTPQVSLIDVSGGATNPPTLLAQYTNIVNNIAVSPGWNYYTLSTPITLTAGGTYAVAAPVYFDEQYNSTSGFTFGSSISNPTFLHIQGFSGWDNSSYDFTALANSSPGARLSANFTYTVAVVPEPSTYVMLGAGMAVLLFGLRRRSA